MSPYYNRTLPPCWLEQFRHIRTLPLCCRTEPLCSKIPHWNVNTCTKLPCFIIQNWQKEESLRFIISYILAQTPGTGKKRKKMDTRKMFAEHPHTVQCTVHVNVTVRRTIHILISSTECPAHFFLSGVLEGNSHQLMFWSWRN